MNKSIVFLASASFLLFGCQSPPTTINDGELSVVVEQRVPKFEEFVQSGDTLPISSIVDVNGQNINLADKNKRKLVILFATWCSDSNRALKALNKSPLLNDPTIEIIAIAREETNEDVIKWWDEHNIKVQLATDVDRSIYKQFAVGGIPRLITVSEDNTVIKMNLAEGEEQLKLIHW
ncbi:MAG: redoxin family protein [Colwellia sp.]|nr:redoxin family protein [Colwellia sp.]